MSLICCGGGGPCEVGVVCDWGDRRPNDCCCCWTGDSGPEGFWLGWFPLLWENLEPEGVFVVEGDGEAVDLLVT